MQKALGLLAAGRRTRSSSQSYRITRRRADSGRLLALMAEQGWAMKIADFDVVSGTSMGGLSPGS